MLDSVCVLRHIYQSALSPRPVSVWSVCRAVSSASWRCRGKSWTSTVWSVGVAPSSAGTADATLPWGTSPSTAWPAQPPTIAQVLLRLPASCHQTRVRGCRLWGFSTNPKYLPEYFFFLKFNHYHACFLFTAKITVSCQRCLASFPAEDIEQHEVYDFCKHFTECVLSSQQAVIKVIPLSISHQNQLECGLGTRRDDEKAEPEEEEREDEGDFSRQGATPGLSSTYKSTSLSDRLRNGPWGDGGGPDQISTCPHCHLALPLYTLRWHKVTFPPQKICVHVVEKFLW